MSHSYVGFKALGMGYDAHLTVLYLGEDVPIETLNKAEEIIKPHLDELRIAERTGINLFGPTLDTPVLLVNVGPNLIELRKQLVEALGNVSEFKDWNPHITLKLEPENQIIVLPHVIKLHMLGVYTS